VRHIPKMRGQTWLLLHPRPLLFENGPTLWLCPTGNVSPCYWPGHFACSLGQSLLLSNVCFEVRQMLHLIKLFLLVALVMRHNFIIFSHLTIVVQYKTNYNNYRSPINTWIENFKISNQVLKDQKTISIITFLEFKLLSISLSILFRSRNFQFICK
jgi:hypothetical protein